MIQILIGHVGDPLDVRPQGVLIDGDVGVAFGPVFDALKLPDGGYEITAELRARMEDFLQSLDARRRERGILEPLSRAMLENVLVYLKLEHEERWLGVMRRVESHV